MIRGMVGDMNATRIVISIRDNSKMVKLMDKGIIHGFNLGRYMMDSGKRVSDLETNK
jgi:hypothetical protein